jgi:hypothetical protein
LRGSIKIDSRGLYGDLNLSLVFADASQRGLD